MGARRSTPARLRRSEPNEPPDPPHADSQTALAAEALRTGVVHHSRRPEILPHEGEVMLVGDPDDSALGNEYVGDETPGGSASTPDQNQVDDIGRAYGLQDEDSGALRTSQEILTRRDRRRLGGSVPRP